MQYTANMEKQLFLLAILTISQATCKTINYHLDVTYITAAPDGVSRRILAFNGQFPGPTIRAQRNDYLILQVTNHLARGVTTSIHWHGYEQHLTPWEDGPAMITQCNIPSNHTHTYEFRAVQSGTYWYHAHYAGQYGDGLWGVMIVDNTPEVHQYDGEFVVAANAWFHHDQEELLHWYVDPEASKGELPFPDSSLINGVGYYPCEHAEAKGIPCSPWMARRHYPLFEVERGKTYRFRFLDSSVITSKYFSIDGHKLQVIETDGVDTERIEGVDVAHIYTGSRTSFLVKMDGTLDQYWIRVRSSLGAYRMNYSNINPIPEAFAETTFAVLRYKDTQSPSVVTDVTNPLATQGRPERKAKFLRTRYTPHPEDRVVIANGFTYYQNDPIHLPMATEPFPNTTMPDSPVELNHMDCTPYQHQVEPPPSYVNQTVVLHIPEMDHPDVLVKPGFNNISYDPMKLDKPAMVKLMLGEEIPKDINPVKINGFGDDYIVELIINDYGYVGHPLHLHGHTFWVMGYGAPNAGPFNETRDRPNLRGTLRRETTPIPKTSWLVLRFRANNPGVWLFHCHMDFHVEAALGMVFIVGEDQAKEMYGEIPKNIVDTCKAGGYDILGTSSAGVTETIPNFMLLLTVTVILALICHGNIL